MAANRDLLSQLPRFSEYDPGATGEGSLDPLGLAAIADRLAEHLALGVRARMSNPRFALLSAVGAYAYQPLIGDISRDGKTTPEIAFEWLVLEALVYQGGRDSLRGLAGSQKAAAAKASGRRMNPSSYLVAPRVFGFNGVYRPFCLDSDILRPDGSCASASEYLLDAWQADQGMDGFVSGQPESLGFKLRCDIERETNKALEKGHAAASIQGSLYKTLAQTLAPQAPGEREKQALRTLVADSKHEVRNEIVRLLQGWDGALGASERDICGALRPAASPETALVLDAIASYEECATLIDHSFRRILGTAATQGGTFTLSQAADYAHVREAAKRISDLSSRAMDSLAGLDETLAHDAQGPIGAFLEVDGAKSFAGALIERHGQTQEAKAKRMWIDPVSGVWVVRPPYRNQDPGLSGEGWLHPMRIQTLVSFLEMTR